MIRQEVDLVIVAGEHLTVPSGSELREDFRHAPARSKSLSNHLKMLGISTRFLSGMNLFKSSPASHAW
jgi:hypothetical protein